MPMDLLTPAVILSVQVSQRALIRWPLAESPWRRDQGVSRQDYLFSGSVGLISVAYSDRALWVLTPGD